ncbi:MAG: O-antigen ligase family protein [Minisyncoccia bacterium]
MNSILYKISKFFLYLTPLCLAVVTNSTFFPFVVGKYVWFRICVDLALIFFSLAFIFSSDKESTARKAWDFVKSPLSIAVGIFTVVFLLAGFFGINPHLSFWSNFERGEGGFQILHLYLFFVLAGVLFKNKDDWKRMMGVFLAGALGVILYGLMVPSEFFHFISGFSNPNIRFQGSLGNPAYAAACFLFAFFYCLFLLLTDFRGQFGSRKGRLLIFLSAVFFLFFILSGTRGAFAGFLVSLLVFLGYFVFRSPARKKILTILLILFLIAITFVYLNNSGFLNITKNYRVFDFSLTDKSFTDRLIVWNVAWNGFLARPVLGWGPENFPQVFAANFNPDYFKPGQDFGTWFDRAHSIVFDSLAETGALGFLSFMAIFFIFFWQFFKSSKSDSGAELDVEPFLVKALLLSVPVAYLVQGLVLFDTLPIYLNLFFFLALSTGYLFKKRL